MRRLLSVLVLMQLGTLLGAGRDPFAFLEPSVSVTSADRRALERGEPVVSILRSDDREIAVFSATKVEPRVTWSRAMAWMRRIEQLREGRYLMAAGRFSNPPRLADLDGLTLDEVDLQDIRTCRPGDCGLKLTSREMAHLRDVAALPGAHWKARVQTAFRGVVLARVRAFMQGGHAALDAHHDQAQPRSAAEAFARLLEHSPFLQRTAPQVTRQLAARAAAPVPEQESLVYWARERLGGKPVISAISVTLRQHIRGSARPEVFTIGVQVLATHYLDATLAVTAVVHDDQTGSTCSVSVHRSDVDVLRGFWAPLARATIEARIRRDGPAILRTVSNRLSDDDPG